MSIAQGAQAVSQRTLELEVAAIQGMINFGQSATATAIQVAQADLAALQGMVEIAEPFMPPVVRNLRETAAKKAVEELSQIQKVVTTTATVIGQTPKTVFVAVLQEETRSQPFLISKNSGTILGGGLTGLEVAQTYQSPLLTDQQKHARAGIQAGTFAIKFGAGKLIGAAIPALTGLSATNPITLGIGIVVSGIAGGGFDVAKEAVLKFFGLQP